MSESQNIWKCRELRGGEIGKGVGRPDFVFPTIVLLEMHVLVQLSELGASADADTVCSMPRASKTNTKIQR
jgi:hypothetical protein